jgi:hypothetical protein
MKGGRALLLRFLPSLIYFRFEKAPNQYLKVHVKTVSWVFFIAVLAIIGCTRDQQKELAKLIDPRFPKRAATHVVELYKVQIGASDFGLSTFGNPLDINISLRQDGMGIAQSNGNHFLRGQRGERVLQEPIQWVVNFDPNKNYQIYLEEQSIIASRHSWAIPGTPQIGYWPIAENKGHISFGQNSYLEFRDKVAN